RCARRTGRGGRFSRAVRARARTSSTVTALAARVRALPSWQLALGGALLALGFLIAAQLASEGPRIRYTSQERQPLVETALDLQSQQDGLKARILELRNAIQQLETAGKGSAALVSDLNAQLQQARIAAGLIPLTGTGLVLQLEDNPAGPPTGANQADYLVQGRDLQTVVEELWLGGAEAISINDERVTTSTAIVDIGGSILVNSAYLAPPYQVAALGPPELFDRLRGSQGFIDLVRARAEQFGIKISFAQPQAIDIPAYAGQVNLRFARVDVGGDANASPTPSTGGPSDSPGASLP
ncbi:MAG: DUF881 domain-containing protein, partial [Chloroflexota bacterium]